MRRSYFPSSVRPPFGMLIHSRASRLPLFLSPSPSLSLPCILSSVSSRVSLPLFACSLHPRINNKTSFAISLTVNSKCKFSTKQRSEMRSVCHSHPFSNYYLQQDLYLFWCLAFTRKQQITVRAA